jgi:hypothetical protein
MPIEFWIFLWQVLLVVALVSFGIMAVVVTIGGAVDILRLLRILREEHARSMGDEHDVDTDAAS